MTWQKTHDVPAKDMSCVKENVIETPHVGAKDLRDERLRHERT